MPHNEELQIRAWDAVIPLVVKLREFYEFSQKLGNDEFLSIIYLF